MHPFTRFFGDHHGHRHFGGKRGFPGGFGGGFGGPGMRAAKMLKSEDLQLILLSLLKEKPRHGYEMIKALEEHSSGVYTPSPGMVYPALTYLEEVGFANSTTEGTKKLFTISDLGLSHLSEHQTLVDETLTQLSRFGRRFARMHQQMNEDETTADDFGRGDKRQSREEFREMKAEFKELRDQLKEALFEKIEASTTEKRRVLDVLKKAIQEIRGK